MLNSWSHFGDEAGYGRSWDDSVPNGPEQEEGEEVAAAAVAAASAAAAEADDAGASGDGERARIVRPFSIWNSPTGEPRQKKFSTLRTKTG